MKVFIKNHHLSSMRTRMRETLWSRVRAVVRGRCPAPLTRQEMPPRRKRSVSETPPESPSPHVLHWTTYVTFLLVLTGRADCKSPEALYFSLYPVAVLITSYISKDVGSGSSRDHESTISLIRSEVQEAFKQVCTSYSSHSKVNTIAVLLVVVWLAVCL